MQSCETCQVQLLEYLYDLLDGADREALEAHLAACPACQEVLAKTRLQQHLLAAAAKMEFPAVAFQPPTDAVTASAPATLPLPNRAQPAVVRKPVKWGRWAVAAAVLIAVAGAGSLAAGIGLNVKHDQDTVQQYEADRQRATQHQSDLDLQLRQTNEERETKVHDIYRAVTERELKLVVQGPASVQPGAPAEYQISTTNLDDKPVSAQVSVQVADNGAKIGEPLSAKRVADGTYRVTLPPDLPLKPQSHPILLVSAKRDTGTKAELEEQLDLASKVYLTHLTTDKPMYQPGETVYFRSLTLDRATLKPSDIDLRLDFTITTPLGAIVLIGQGGNGLVKEGAGGTLTAINGPDGKPIKGIGAGSYHLDGGLPGGEYILTVREELNRFPEQQRKFVVNKYQKPRLNKELDFNRKTYGAGDEVQAAVKVTSNDDTPLNGKVLNAAVTVDGKQYDAAGKESNKVISFKLEADGKTGKATVRFKLPTAIEKGEANLNLTFQDGANVESLSRSIPIVLKKLNVEFYPEGGDLVAGLPNRVYFSVRTTLGKPADLKGRLLENGKPLEVAVATLSDDKEPGVNQGMGRFEFTPKVGAKYELQIDTPVGITSQHVLPGMKEDGVVMRVAEGVVGSNGQIKVSVSSTKERTLLVGAYCRGRLLDSVKLDKVDPKKSSIEATLKVGAGAGGVCRITVFEEKTILGATRRELQPVAERLVYKEPKEQLLVPISADKDAYVPGQRVKLTIKTVNEDEKAAPAVVMLAVVDKSVVTMADEKTARSMPTHFLLTTEVQRPEDLEYADFLLGTQAEAKQALDLLLGTQGWRRFAEQDPTKFRQEHKDEAERLLVTIGQSAPRVTTFTKEKVDKVDEEYDARVTELQKEEQSAGTEASAAATAAPYLAAKANLNVWKNRWDRFTFFGTPVLGMLLLLLAAVCMAMGLTRELSQARRYYAAAAASMALMLLAFGFWGTSLKLDRRDASQMATVFIMTEAIAERAQARDRAPQFDRGARQDAENQAFAGAKLPGGGGGQGAFAAPNAAMPADAKPAAELERLKELAKFDDKAEGLGAEGRLRNEQNRMLRGGGFAGKGEAKKREADGLFEQFGKDMKAKAPEMPMKPGQPGMRPFPVGQQPMGGPRADFDRRQMQLASLPPLFVREYTHERTVGMTPEMRSDWTETLYWQPVLVLPDGKAEVSFDLCDSTTTFQVTAFAHSLDGRLGATTYNIDSRLPFTLQPKLPIEVTASDKIDVPLSLTNNTGEKRKVSVNLKELEGLALIKGEKNDEFEMQSGVPVRKVYRFMPTIQDGEAKLTFEGKTAPFAADAVKNTFRVVPEGFPFVGSHSDVLEGSSLTTVNLPETWVKGSLKCQVNVYPSTLADLQKGLEGLLREPNGCFEQTSTTNYPNVLILGYLKDSDQSKPEVEKRARELIGRGYQRLTSFECTNTGKQNKKEGYEWFGGTAPAHEALTAYGLLQFRDMAKVSDVDPQMLERTRQYLMEQRDGKGGFKRNPQAIDTFGRAPQHITDAYIVWALTEGSADDDVTKELDELVKQAKTSKDPYFLALVANSLVNRSRHVEATELLKTIAGLQKEDGHLDAETTSITGSGGRDLQIETTSLSMLAWLKANNPAAFTPNVVKAVKWIGQQRGGYGGFGSTQSTILALKALIAYTKANKKTPEAGELTVYVGDKPAGKVAFPAGAAESLTLSLENVEETLQPGANKVRVEMTGKNVFPYTLTWTYNTLKPTSAEKTPVKLETSLSKAEAAEGDGVRLLVKLENVSGQGQGMAVAVVGLPGGLTIPEDLKQLKEYTRLPVDGSRPLVSAFEIRGRELVLYWRDLAPGQKIEVPVDLTCRVPGEYSGPASRAYLYYNADFKHWVEPLKVNIAAK